MVERWDNYVDEISAKIYSDTRSLKRSSTAER